MDSNVIKCCSNCSKLIDYGDGDKICGNKKDKDGDDVYIMINYDPTPDYNMCGGKLWE